MRRMMQLHMTFGSSVSNKLQSSSGETIVETLVAILISAIALMLLAGTISTSVHIVISSKEHMEGYYNNESELIESTTENSTSFGTVTSDVPITGTSGVTDVDVYGNEASGLYLYNKKKAVTP